MIKSRISKPEIIVGSMILIALTTVATPNIFGAFAKARKSKTINNARQVGIAMVEFENQYGSFPSKDSVKVLEEEGEDLLKGDTANHYFAQLLVSKVLDSERVFYVDGLVRTKKADDVFNTPKTALAQGENGFGYILKQNADPFSFTDRADVPVAVAPLLKGGKQPTFQSRLFHGEGVALRVDCSVGIFKINKQGELLSKKTGKNLFLSGEDTIWGKDTPIVKEPWLLEEKKKEAK